MLTQHNRHFTNNSSGNLNKKQEENKYKLIDLNDFDVQMLSPDFLQAKTLKKPLNEYPISLSKTNPQGVEPYSAKSQNKPTQDKPSAVNFQKPQPKTTKITTPSPTSFIDISELNIKPAYQKKSEEPTSTLFRNSLEAAIQTDKNTILSALLRKGQKMEVALNPNTLLPKQQKTIGPAQAKLKTMMKRDISPNIQVSAPKEQKLRKMKIKSEPDSIGEEINEQIDQYGNESFEKLSVGYESAIKESIAAESNFIKESIKQSIRESIRQSLNGSASQIKQSIRQEIRESFGGGSSRSLKEQIAEQISASKGKSKESIQQVYQQIFQDFQGSSSLSKSQNRFKKTQHVKQMDSLSHSASKSFRMKTNVLKQIKHAEQINSKTKDYIAPKISDPKINEELSKQKSNLKKLQENISQFLTSQPPSTAKDKYSNLYYQFKIELNKLITNDNFGSKLKKLTDFLSDNKNVSADLRRINELQDNILKNVMTQISDLRLNQANLNEIQKIKLEYEQKLKEQLLVQEVNLRAEMNQKLSQKDLELKTMIAELESKMMKGSFHPGAKTDMQKSERFEVDSDYSIDSDNVSWKADLWQLLPEYEKKKLYQKQSAQVTQFLADIMVNQLQEQALDRSLDISFEFPEEYNNIPVKTNQPSSRYQEEKAYETPSFAKPSAFKKDPESKYSSDFLSDLPKLPGKKSTLPQQSSSWPQKEQQLKSQRIRRDDKIKPQIIKIFSEYKYLYLKKKQQVIKNILKVLYSKQSETKKYLYSAIQQLNILNDKQLKKEHKFYIKAYEEEIYINLLAIYNRSLNKKPNAVEEEMKKMYDRLVVVCQVSVAEKCTERVALDAQRSMPYNVQVLTKNALSQMQQHPCAIDIITPEAYMELKTKNEQKQIKNDLVKQIVDILATELARQFPKKKK